MTTTEIIKTYVCETIFQNGYPETLENKHPFDFFIEADVNCAEGVDESPLGTEWGFEVASEYAFDNIRAIRGLMASMQNDLESLKNKLFEKSIKKVHVNMDDFVDINEFYQFALDSNAPIQREGTADEYVTIFTVDPTKI
jgi:hypothetical protein